MKYKINDVVRVRSDLKNNIKAVPEMYKYEGKKATIIKILDNWYKLDINDNDYDRWSWFDEMLEPVTQQKRCKLCGRFTKEEHSVCWNKQERLDKMMNKQFDTHPAVVVKDWYTDEDIKAILHLVKRGILKFEIS